MPLTGSSRLVGFDAEAALAAARDVADGGVLSFVEFTHDEFTTLYVADEILAMYEDEDHLRDHYGRVLSHLHMDFLERDTYEETLLPNAGRVRSLVTTMEQMTLLRVLDDGEGLYVALDPDVPAAAVTEAIEAVVRDEA